MDLQYEVTQADVSAAHAEAVRLSGIPGRAASLANVVVYIPFGIALAALWRLWHDGAGHTASIAIAGLSLLVFLLLATAFTGFMQRRQRRAMQSWVGPLPRSVQGALREDGLHFSSALGSSHVAWPALLSLRRSVSHLFVLSVPGLIHAIPLHAFATPAQADDFERTLRRHLPERIA